MLIFKLAKYKIRNSWNWKFEAWVFSFVFKNGALLIKCYRYFRCDVVAFKVRFSGQNRAIFGNLYKKI
jgi:hypothetical protein